MVSSHVYFVSMSLDEKRKACLSEINRMKNMRMDPVKYLSQQSAMSSKGVVTISNLRIPLRKEFVDLLKGKGEPN